jgi:hypothetical protein
VPDGSPELALSVALDSDPDCVTATVTLDGFDSEYEATAMAQRTDPSTEIEFKLAVSRALSALEHRMMEEIHERIDRVTDDV